MRVRTVTLVSTPCLVARAHVLSSPIVLRDRLEKETVLRKLTEESCEAERRRRKQVEGMLDDARREYRQPHVVPAMMDAFEKIAALTGEALMAVDDEET